jgi:hypothetical protein
MHLEQKKVVKKMLKIQKTSIFLKGTRKSDQTHMPPVACEHVCYKLNQSKFERFFSQTSPSGFFILFHLKTLFHII